MNVSLIWNAHFRRCKAARSLHLQELLSVWQAFLSDFNLEVAHIPGATNDSADGLSRRPDLHLMIIGACAPYDPWLKRIKVAYETDPGTKAPLMQVKQGPVRLETGLGSYEQLHGALYFISDEDGLHRVYVPHGTIGSGKTLRQQLISEFHDSPIAGHLGSAKCIAALTQYWPNLEADVRNYISHCDICQRVKPTKQPNPVAHPLPTPARPFEHMTLDRVTGFPQSQGYNAVPNVVDRFTKWAIAIPCNKEMKAHSFCEALWQKVFSWDYRDGAVVPFE